jgi:hypothetical protein
MTICRGIIHSWLLLNCPYKCSKETYLLRFQKCTFKAFPAVKCQGSYMTNSRLYKRKNVLEENSFHCGKQAFRVLVDASLTSSTFSASFTVILLKQLHPTAGLLIFQQLTLAFSSRIPKPLMRYRMFRYYSLGRICCLSKLLCIFYEQHFLQSQILTLFLQTLSQVPLLILVGRTTAQASSHRLPTAAARGRGKIRSTGICGGQSGAGVVLLRVLRLPLSILIPPSAPRSSSIIRMWYNRTNISRRTKWTQFHTTPRI